MGPWGTAKARLSFAFICLLVFVLFLRLLTQLPPLFAFLPVVWRWEETYRRWTGICASGGGWVSLLVCFPFKVKKQALLNRGSHYARNNAQRYMWELLTSLHRMSVWEIWEKWRLANPVFFRICVQNSWIPSMNVHILRACSPVIQAGNLRGTSYSFWKHKERHWGRKGSNGLPQLYTLRATATIFQGRDAYWLHKGTIVVGETNWFLNGSDIGSVEGSL